MDSQLTQGENAKTDQKQNHFRDYAEMIPRWISIQERLPGEEGDYLVASEITGYVGVRHFYKTCPQAFTWQSACTHWMNLPESPRRSEIVF